MYLYEKKGNAKEGHKLDNFMEWLSDNLRYFILGLLVVVVLVIVVLGFRFASSKSGDGEQKPPTTQVTETKAPEEQQEQQEQGSESVVTVTPMQPISSNNLLEKNAYPQVNAVIQKYYQALSAKNVEGIKEVVDELGATEATKITNDQHIDGYSDIEVYTKEGVKESEYIVLARYNYKFKDIDKKVPGLSMMYVKPREDGSLHITMQAQDEQVQELIAKTREEMDVKELIQNVEGEYAKVQEEDETLRNFISGFGIASSQAAKAENGATVTVKGDCNVRDRASADGEVVAKLTKGTQVTKVGTEGEWIQISFEEGRTGYVRSDLFE